MATLGNRARYLDGENCGMIVWVRMEKPQVIAKFVAREFAMVYGDYEKVMIERAEKWSLTVPK